MLSSDKTWFLWKKYISIEDLKVNREKQVSQFTVWLKWIPFYFFQVLLYFIVFNKINTYVTKVFPTRSCSMEPPLKIYFPTQILWFCDEYHTLCSYTKDNHIEVKKQNKENKTKAKTKKKKKHKTKQNKNK